MRLLSPEELLDAVELIAADGFCAEIADIARDEIFNLTPPEKISTVDCAVKYRLIRNAEGDTKRHWSRTLTPYNIAPMDACDDPAVNEIVIVKPARTGGTVIAENVLFRTLKFGPMTDVLWYLASDSEVKSYCDKQVKPLFEDHPDIAAKIGSGRSDNNDTSKKISGRMVEWLPANNKTFTGRQSGLMVFDEIDTWTPRMCASAVNQARIRGRALGSRRKVIMLSHPDKGWATGIANAWSTSSRGIGIMRCAECSGYASPWPTKFWPEIPQFTLAYDKAKDRSQDERLAMAESTAAMLCPHCGSLLSDEQRKAMVDGIEWLNRGQTLDQDRGVVGDIAHNPSRGFYQHGLISKMVTNAELARDLETALIKVEQTGKTEQLREVCAKVFGEVFDGTTGRRGASSAHLQKRAATERVLQVGECPSEGKFITCAIDVGSGKFDVSYEAWDLESRSWWLDRQTLRQRVWSDGQMRDLKTRERVEDWEAAIYPLLDRLFPIVGKPGFAMPVAVMTVDVGDGNVVWKAREFARRALARGYFWGSPSHPWARVRLIQGSPNAKATELPIAPAKISKDEYGKPVMPVILEYSLGVHKLKELTVDRLGIDDGGPGQCLFADGIDARFYEEFFNERLIDGKWERNGPNESLDLKAYNEAARLMLRPDRADIKWGSGKLPPWATPVEIVTNVSGEAERPVRVEKPKKKSIFERFDALNSSNED